MAKRKREITIDLDDTVAYFFKYAFARLNEVCQTDYQLEQATSWNVHHWMPKEHAEMVWQIASEEKIYLELIADPMAVAAIQEMHSRGHTIGFASGRPSHTLNTTKAWLESQGLPYESLQVGAGVKLKLALAAVEEKRDLIIIDDDPNLAKDLALPKPGLTFYLLKRPYTGQTPLGVTLVDNWQEILDEL